jgi:hypothetical protein
VTCHNCRIEAKRFGKHRNGLPYTEAHEKPLEGMTTPHDKALLALRLLVEGNSVRSIERTTELHRDTILRLLVLVGEKCEKIMGRLIVNVPVKDVQCDEIWAFVQKKEGHKAPFEAHNDGIGDAYCFVAIERYTKLVLNFALGRRSQAVLSIPCWRENVDDIAAALPANRTVGSGREALERLVGRLNGPPSVPTPRVADDAIIAH